MYLDHIVGFLKKKKHTQILETCSLPRKHFQNFSEGSFERLLGYLLLQKVPNCFPLEALLLLFVCLL